MKCIFFFMLVAYNAAAAADAFVEVGDLPNGGKIWVLLVAGSRGYYNYRHQADICHAYHVVSNHGIPDENIIVMMFDDIANSEDNPIPGKIFNRPNGPDVYAGVPKDYTGGEVNWRSFLAILSGVDMTGYGSGKTLKSGPNDHIFVYFADHGAPGVLCFPDDQYDLLNAKDLIETIKDMYSDKKYRKMVFYVEACESGSMFKGLLPEDINVYATTAANSTTSSYACYWSNELKTFLADVYSAKWMENSDVSNLNHETLEDQYEKVKYETNTSTVCQFGDVDNISKMSVSNFQGKKRKIELVGLSDPIPDECGRDAVPSPDVEKISLERLMQLDSGLEEEERIQVKRRYLSLMEGRANVDNVIRGIVTRVTNGEKGTMERALASVPELSQYECYYKAIGHFKSNCFRLSNNDWALRRLYVLANLCEMGYKEKSIVHAIDKQCSSRPMISVH